LRGFRAARLKSERRSGGGPFLARLLGLLLFAFGFSNMRRARRCTRSSRSFPSRGAPGILAAAEARRRRRHRRGRRRQSDVTYAADVSWTRRGSRRGPPPPARGLPRLLHLMTRTAVGKNMQYASEAQWASRSCAALPPASRRTREQHCGVAASNSPERRPRRSPATTVGGVRSGREVRRWMLRVLHDRDAALVSAYASEPALPSARAAGVTPKGDAAERTPMRGRGADRDSLEWPVASSTPLPHDGRELRPHRVRRPGPVHLEYPRTRDARGSDAYADTQSRVAIRCRTRSIQPPHFSPPNGPAARQLSPGIVATAVRAKYLAARHSVCRAVRRDGGGSAAQTASTGPRRRTAFLCRRSSSS